MAKHGKVFNFLQKTSLLATAMPVRIGFINVTLIPLKCVVHLVIGTKIMYFSFDISRIIKEKMSINSNILATR